jgi:hypothetical protein
MDKYKLIKEILLLSESKVWDNAKLEWNLNFITFEKNRCICNHHIVENCHLINTKNNNSCIVGNVCVNKFLDIPSNNIFNGVKKIKNNLDSSVNESTLEFIYLKKWISDFDFTFYWDVFRKQKLSTKQLEVKRKINIKILKSLGLYESKFKQKKSLFDIEKIKSLHSQKKINDWEYSFCEDIEKRYSDGKIKSLTEKQLAKVENIKEKLELYKG